MTKPSPALAAAIKGSSAIQPDKLDALRGAVRTLRDLQLSIKDLEASLDEKKKQVTALTTKDLIDLFDEAGVRSVGLEPEGNVPAYDAIAAPYCRANIAASWPHERQAAAFEWLEGNGHGDVIKTVITVELGRGDRDKAEAAEKALDEIGVDYARKLGVPHGTLTALVRELIANNKTPPLDVLGASVGRVVNLKERK